jgi:hypothetical protein
VFGIAENMIACAKSDGSRGAPGTKAPSRCHAWRLHLGGTIVSPGPSTPRWPRRRGPSNHCLSGIPTRIIAGACRRQMDDDHGARRLGSCRARTRPVMLFVFRVIYLEGMHWRASSYTEFATPTIPFRPHNTSTLFITASLAGPAQP